MKRGRKYRQARSRLRRSIRGLKRQYRWKKRVQILQKRLERSLGAAERVVARVKRGGLTRKQFAGMRRKYSSEFRAAQKLFGQLKKITG